MKVLLKFGENAKLVTLPTNEDHYTYLVKKAAELFRITKPLDLQTYLSECKDWVDIESSSEISDMLKLNVVEVKILHCYGL